MTAVIPLTPDQAYDPRRVGGKAAALARLNGLAPIPSWVVLPPEAFGPAGLTEDAAASLRALLPELGPGPYAVRSSAVQEDGETAAHAGQFLSLLDVAADELSEATARVWRSGFAAHVAAYQAARGIAAEPCGAAVIVQRQLAPRVAGVAFSADPVSGRRDRVVISAVAGLADRLMSGEVDGDTLRIDRAANVVVETLAAGDQPVLSPAEALRVAALAVACEEHFGCPQDVEWGFEGDILHLLQSRPITTLPIADDALTIWDNSNIVESYPGWCSALTFSFARHVYAHVYRVLLGLLGVPATTIAEHRAVLENLLGRIDGRVYYNLLNWYRLIALLPGFALNRHAMEQMMGVAEALPDAVADGLAPALPNGFARLRARLRMGGVALALTWRAVWLPLTIRRFNRRLAVALAEGVPLSSQPLTALARAYRALEAALLERWDAPLLNDLICMIAFALSRKVLERWAGAEGLALHAEVMIGQGDIVSAEPAQRIRAMGRLAADQPELLRRLAEGDATAVDAASPLAAAIRAYLARFGDRCTAELKLESTPLTDDPAPLLRAIGASGAVNANPTTTARTPPNAAARLDELFAGQPLRRWATGLLLAWAKARVRDRENLRLERTRLFGRVRRIVQAMGKQLAAAGALDHADDVFHLSIDEVLGAVEGGAVDFDLRSLAARRRAAAAGDAAKPDPPERISMQGPVVLATRTDDSPATAAAAEDDYRRRGVACAPGLVRGRARVVLDPRNQSVQPGEILVARHTDPGWIALFANAAAIVVERGSLLSHSAIVARELGIPCIVGLKGATGWIVDGEQVEIDGATGWVERQND